MDSFGFNILLNDKNLFIISEVNKEACCNKNINNKLHIGDILEEINGKSINKMTSEELIKLINVNSKSI